MVTDSSNLVAIKPGDKHWGETFTDRIKTWLSAITQEPVVASWPSWSSGSIQSRNFSMPETWTFHNPILIANFYSRLQLRASDAKNLVMQSFNVKPGFTLRPWISGCVRMCLKAQTQDVSSISSYPITFMQKLHSLHSCSFESKISYIFFVNILRRIWAEQKLADADTSFLLCLGNKSFTLHKAT